MPALRRNCRNLKRFHVSLVAMTGARSRDEGRGSRGYHRSRGTLMTVELGLEHRLMVERAEGKEKTMGSFHCSVRGVRANLELVDAPGKVIASLRASARRANSTLRHASTSPPALKATFTRHDRDYRLFAEYNQPINHPTRFIVESAALGRCVRFFFVLPFLFLTNIPFSNFLS